MRIEARALLAETIVVRKRNEIGLSWDNPPAKNFTERKCRLIEFRCVRIDASCGRGIG